MRLSLIATALLYLAAGAEAHAQNYPHRVVRIIVPFVPGGPTGIQARWAARQLSNALGQNFIVETGFVSYNWNGVLAPAKTPREIITRVHDVPAKQLALPEQRESFVKQGHEIAGYGPDEYANFIRTEIEKWARVAKAAGIQKQ